MAETNVPPTEAVGVDESWVATGVVGSYVDDSCRQGGDDGCCMSIALCMRRVAERDPVSDHLKVVDGSGVFWRVVPDKMVGCYRGYHGLSA